jgi:hypothetical protein
MLTSSFIICIIQMNVNQISGHPSYNVFLQPKGERFWDMWRTADGNMKMDLKFMEWKVVNWIQLTQDRLQ